MKFNEIANSPYFTQDEDFTYENDGFIMFFANSTDDQVILDADGDAIDSISHAKGDDEFTLTLSGERSFSFPLTENVYFYVFKQVAVL